MKEALNSQEIAVAVVRAYFPPRRWAVCQNVSWSLLPYEADIIAVSKAGTIHEIEIKISRSDLKADVKKERWRDFPYKPPYVDCYWLAVPEKLKDAAVERAEEIGAGVIFVGWRGDCDKVREPRRWLKKDVAPLLMPHEKMTTESIARHRGEIRNKVWRLAAMRYWDIVFQKANEE